MTVKILIKRKIAAEQQEKLLPLLVQLRKAATAQTGYISGETLRSIRDPEEYLVISTWQTAENWNEWYNSLERKQLQEQIDSLLKEPTEYSVYTVG